MCGQISLSEFFLIDMCEKIKSNVNGKNSVIPQHVEIK